MCVQLVGVQGSVCHCFYRRSNAFDVFLWVALVRIDDIDAAPVPELEKQQETAASSSAIAKPRLGFLGVGWIGRNRMEMIAKHDAGEVVYISDTAAHNAEEALKSAPKAKQVSSLEANTKASTRSSTNRISRTCFPSP